MQDKSHPLYRINDFFEAYAHAVELHDTKFTARCYSLPCLFIADDSTLVYTDSAKLEGLINQGKRFYALHDIASAVPDIKNKRMVTARIVQVNLNWKYVNSKGKTVYDCDYLYTLKLDEQDEWKIEVAVSINEKEKIEALTVVSSKG